MFLYPESRVYGNVDALAELVARRMVQTRMRTSSLLVKTLYHAYDGHEQVHQVSSPFFRMTFGRPQRFLGKGVFDYAALAEVVVPDLRLHLLLSKDPAKLRLYQYVGTNWESEQEWFLDSQKFAARLNRQPRRCLLYTGSMTPREPGWKYSGTLPKYLVADESNGREYRRMEGEVMTYETAKVLGIIEQWLWDNVAQPLGIEPAYRM